MEKDESRERSQGTTALPEKGKGRPQAEAAPATKLPADTSLSM
jgi:hypothetical protein